MKGVLLIGFLCCLTDAAVNNKTTTYNTPFTQKSYYTTYSHNHTTTIVKSHNTTSTVTNSSISTTDSDDTQTLVMSQDYRYIQSEQNHHITQMPTTTEDQLQTSDIFSFNDHPKLITTTQNIQKSPTAVTNEQTDLLTNILNNYGILVYLAAGLIILFFIGLCLGIYCWNRSRKSGFTTTKNGAMDSTSVILASEMKEMPPTEILAETSNRTYQMATESTTVFSGEQEMSMPGFLLMKRGKDYQFRQEKLLTSGGFSLIYKVELKSQEALQRNFGNSTCVVKVLKPVTGTKEEIEEETRAFDQEVSVTWFFHQHRNFIKVLGYQHEPNTLIMPYYSLGTLEDVLCKKSPVSWSLPLTVSILGDLINGLVFMLQKGFIHCDIKPSNLLLEKQNHSPFPIGLLSDFGVTQIINSSSLLVKEFRISKLRGASVHYAPPEIIAVLLPGPQVPQRYQKFLNKSAIKGAETLRLEQEQLKKNATICMEVNLESEWKSKWDVYSFGISAFESLTRRDAWPSGLYADQKQILVGIVKRGDRPNWYFDEERLSNQFSHPIREQDFGWKKGLTVAEAWQWKNEEEQNPRVKSGLQKFRDCCEKAWSEVELRPSISEVAQLWKSVKKDFDLKE